MEILPQLKALAEKIDQLKDHIETEESTKHAFVLPFLNLLGYDTYNPLEVKPEFTADLGLKKGEKVDYAVFQDGQPILIIECKHWKEKLDVHNSQLFRYFHVTQTRFALLTNGIEYRFYTDLENQNKMDEKPFLEFSLANMKENLVAEVGKFHKSNFDVNKIVNNASNLKYTKEIRNLIESELEEPSAEFVRPFAKKVYSGPLRENVINEFSEIIQRAFNQIVNERVNNRLNQALHKETERQKEQEPDLEQEEESKVVTTDEELEGFQIVKAILRRKLPSDRIAYRDTQSYFGVLLDDNNRKPICRLRFNSSTKYLGTFNAEKNETKHVLESLDDIYKYEMELLAVVDSYES